MKPQAPPEHGVGTASRWVMRLVLLVAVLVPLAGCGGLGTAAAATSSAPSRFAAADQHESEHHLACERAGTPLAVHAPVRPVHADRSVPPAGAQPVLLPRAGDGVAAVDVGTPRSTSWGCRLLLSIGVARR